MFEKTSYFRFSINDFRINLQRGIMLGGYAVAGDRIPYQICCHTPSGNDEVRQSGCNGFADEEIYSMALHYYDEEDMIAIC